MNIERESLISMVEGLKKQDSAAIEMFWEVCQNDLFHQIRQTLGKKRTTVDPDLTTELLHTAVVKILEDIDQLREPAAFITWSRRIAYHVCTDYFDKHHELVADENEDHQTIIDNIEDDNIEFIPGEMLEKQELRQIVINMVNELPAEQRSALYMRYYDEISVKEIAEIQSVSEGTVKSRLNYARKSVKKSIEDYEKKSGIKLHCVGIVPLLLWVFRQQRLAEWVLPTGTGTAAAGTVAAGATAAGATVAGTTAAGATAAGATAAGAVAVGTATAGTVAAGTAAGTALAAKIIAGITAAVVAVGGVTAAVVTTGDKAPTEPPAVTITTEATAPIFTQPIVTEPTESEPTETVPTETEPTETEPTETEPAETEPTETEPTETEPTETEPAETEPAETEPVVQASEGLEFTLSDDGTYYIFSGIGSCTDTDVVIPAEYNGLPVRRIDQEAIKNNASITSITIPEGITTIGNSAFSNCKRLASITIPASVTSIGSTLFQYNNNLSEIIVAQGNPVYHSDGNCLIETASKTIIIGCKTSVIPTDDSVTTIGAEAFKDCGYIANITIPGNIKTIEASAFSCSKIAGVTMMDGVESIGIYAFGSCSSLSEVIMPDSVTYIDLSAFACCTSLTAVTIPAGVTKIEDGAFSSCENLTSLSVAEGNPVYHSDGNCIIETATKTLIVGCTTSVIPSDGSVTRIGSLAFYGPNNLTSITIPDCITVIGTQAFDYCENLTDIYFTGTMEQWNAIEKGSWWAETTGAYVIHCSDGDIPKS